MNGACMGIITEFNVYQYIWINNSWIILALSYIHVHENFKYSLLDTCTTSTCICI